MRRREMTGDFDEAVRSILGRMIEARTDQDEADKHLRDYRAANRPPDVPNEFEDVDTFLDYHHRRQGYEDDLRQHENALKKAKKEYASAPGQLMPFLPDGVPLRYPYQGGGASCRAQSTSSCASRARSLSRVQAAPS